ncbi:TetR family transcriptional regulator [Frondihabitans sp. PhB188]|uniref:TetR/AcrR family transcriptional regulator n=1 Tax=Frondihabitans sp. PhB188 TaxID=2485200 RepID=UPI000F46DF75|nr:TetR family transcriptional regulator [Frondihabitans sp. PhB188]ROQ36541.1 TetR family transcriptional regulator [Frondihabitans sp. PhB188]
MASSLSLTSVVIDTDAERAILRAADSLFTEHSIDWVTLDAIADRAESSVGEITRRYATKREILVAVLAYKHQGWVARLEKNGTRVDDPRDEILEVFSYMEECFADTTWRGCCFVNAYAEVGREDEGIAALAVQHFEEVERHMSVLCARAGLPDYVSDALTILIQGARAEAGIHHTAKPARSARLAAAMLMSVYQNGETVDDRF